MTGPSMSRFPNPPQEHHCDLPQCLACGNVADDLNLCVWCNDAWLHDHCGDKCEACGMAVCSACVDYWDDNPFCPECILATGSYADDVMLEESTLS